MGHQVKRFLSLLLCGVMLLSLSPVHVHAASGSETCSNPGGHVFQGVVDTDPQSVGYYPECPNAKVYQLKCMYCDQERGYYGGQHEWSGWTTSPDDTQSRRCALCDQVETKSAPVHTHTLEKVTVPATCTKDGYTYERCTKCAYEGPKTTTSPATGHVFVDDGDCTTSVRCTICGEWNGETFYAQHKFTGSYAYDESGHWRHCVNPGCRAVSTVERHRTTGGVGDCTKGEVCTECGATVAMGREHNFENGKVGQTTATGHYLFCTNPGCGQVQFFAHSFSTGKCTVCGVADPNYKPAQEPENQEEQKDPVTQETPAASGTQASQASQGAQKAPAAQGAQTASTTQSSAATQATPEVQMTPEPQEPQVVAVAQVAQGSAPTVAEKFSDVSATAWYAGNVQRVVEAGLMNGVSDSAFSPNTNVNRAMLVTILYRLADEPGPGMGNFIDVKESAYYADAVSWAATTGLVSGFKDHSFQPGQDITRQELAAILYRYAKWMGYRVDGADDLSAFADRGQIASWAYEAMAWANREGILNGRSGNELAPTATATRAEVATIMARMMDLMGAQ